MTIAEFASHYRVSTEQARRMARAGVLAKGQLRWLRVTPDSPTSPWRAEFPRATDS